MRNIDWVVNKIEMARYHGADGCTVVFVHMTCSTPGLTQQIAVHPEQAGEFRVGQRVDVALIAR